MKKVPIGAMSAHLDTPLMEEDFVSILMNVNYLNTVTSVERAPVSTLKGPLAAYVTLVIGWMIAVGVLLKK